MLYVRPARFVPSRAARSWTDVLMVDPSAGPLAVLPTPDQSAEVPWLLVIESTVSEAVSLSSSLKAIDSPIVCIFPFGGHNFVGVTVTLADSDPSRGSDEGSSTPLSTTHATVVVPPFPVGELAGADDANTPTAPNIASELAATSSFFMIPPASRVLWLSER